MLLGGVGAHQAEAPVGVLRARGPDLLAVDQIVVALVLALGLQRGEIRSRARLGEALAPAQFALDDRRDVPALLLLTAIFQQGRAEHHHAHAANGAPGADLVHFLLQGAGLAGRQAAAAIGLGPGGRAPSLFAHGLGPGPVIRIGGRSALLHHHAAAPLERRREVGLEPVSRIGAEGFEVFASKVGHQLSPLKIVLLFKKSVVGLIDF